MTRSAFRRTLVTASGDCQWTCGRHAVREFFSGASPGDPHSSRLRVHGAAGPRIIVTDENVERLHRLDLPADMPRIVVPPGEQSKTFGCLSEVLRAMLGLGLDRAATVIAFGGGVVGDLAGFAAATFMRGIRWVNVPTTLLAMVDASIGGKTGVDVAGVKNLAGAFHPPTAIVADPALLATLPQAERASGMAEVIKQAVIGSPSLFERLERGLFDDDHDVALAATVKLDIVERDGLERGERAVLNLGHTIGHGLESASDFRLPHGEAVAIGLVAETGIAQRLGLASPVLADRLAAALGQFGLPTRAAVTASSVRDAMAADKKRSRGRLRFALPRDIGDVVYGVEVEERVVMEALREVCAGR